MSIDLVTSTYDTRHEPLEVQLLDRVSGLHAFTMGRIFVAGGEAELAAGLRTLSTEVARAVRGVTVPVEAERGAAVRAALSAALAESDAAYFAMMNLNRKVPMRDLERAAALQARMACDVVVGSRRDEDGGVAVGRGVLGDAKSAAWTALVKRALPRLARFRDPSAPLKIMNRRAAEVIVGRARVDGIGFDVEWLSLWVSAGLSIEMSPIRWTQASGSRPPWGAVPSMVRDVWRLRAVARAAPRSDGRDAASMIDDR